MSVGENIRKLRQEKGMTQKELGEKCGIADSAIRRYELGGANPKMETLHKIAKALDKSIILLVEGCEDKYPLTTDDYKIDLTSFSDYQVIPRIEENICTAQTIAAHFEGESFTEDELKLIRSYVEFLKSQRKATDSDQ